MDSEVGSTTQAGFCGATGCRKTITARGLCRKHYLQAWRAGTFTQLPMRSNGRFECSADHPHDVETCWKQHGCRCDDCRHLRRMERQLRRGRLVAEGRVDEIREKRVPAEPVREHLAELMEHAGLEKIADAAGVPRSAVANVYYGPRAATNRNIGTPPQAMRASLASRILAVTTDDLTPRFVSSTGTIRRLRALVAIGYSQTDLAARMGVQVGNFSPIILGRRPRVSAKTHTKASKLFVELWASPVEGLPGDRSRALAKSRGWVGPLAWDDIDDPTEVPNVRGEKPMKQKQQPIDEIAVELAMNGEKVKLTSAERRVAVTRLHSQRWSDSYIAGALHIDPRSVLRIRQDLGLEAFDFSEIRQVESA